MTEIVASAHNAYKSPNVGSVQSARHNITIGLHRGQLHVYGLVSRFRLCNQVWQGHIGIRPDNQIGMMFLQKFFLRPFCHTSQHTDDYASALSLLAVPVFQTAQYLLFSGCTYRTGIQKNCVRLIRILADFVSCHIHDGSDHLAVCHVHLAAVCFYEKLFHHQKW